MYTALYYIYSTGRLNFQFPNKFHFLDFILSLYCVFRNIKQGYHYTQKQKLGTKTRDKKNCNEM